MNWKQTTKKYPTQTGFTLFEVLIAVLILSVGLLGLAALQAESMRNNNSSYMRSQASSLAYDIADRIRANLQGDYLTPLPNGTETTGCLSAPGCNPDTMAANDVFEWQTSVGNTLPQGTGTYARNGNVYTVSITWVDEFNNNADMTFQTSFIP